MSQAAFRLVESTDPPQSLRFERRAEARRQISGSATVICTQDSTDEPRHIIGSLRLRDLSSHGLGAISSQALPIGAFVELMMPAHGPDGGFNLRGKIIRCEPADQGYDVGVSLYQASAAVA